MRFSYHLNTWATAGILSVLSLTVGAQTPLPAGRVSNVPLTDPSAPFWAQQPVVEVPMLPQNVTTPNHLQPTVSQLQVRAAHDGFKIAFLIEWSDATMSLRNVVNQFADNVAIELPVNPKPEALPAPMMGHLGGRVSILQWRSVFQNDLIAGAPTVRSLYPNALVDVYPDELLKASDARPYQGALGLDNPVSRPRGTPVIEQMAEGWGTLTDKAAQHGEGMGAWKDGKWQVVISHPLLTQDENDTPLTPGLATSVAFAVWDGGNHEVGARKAWANWVPLQIAP